MTDKNNMTPEELGQLYPIFIAEYDDSWPLLFQQEKVRLENILGRTAENIQHVGSTSVPGLDAKPTVDIAVIIPEDADRNRITKIMENAGYTRMTEQEQLMFVRGYGPEGLEDESYHIHMGPKSLTKIGEMAEFRDLLREDPDTAGQYRELKYRLAKQHRHNREDYTEAKTEFIRHSLDKLPRHI